jgi:hypothetical protein
MKTRIVLVTLAVGTASFLLTRVIWPDVPGAAQPSAAQLPFFIVLSILESLFFGLGVAFLVFGLPLVQRASRIAGIRIWPVYLSIGWLLGSWWPHDNLHRVTEGNLNALIGIEYGFHVTLMITGAVLAWFLVGVARRSVALRPVEETERSRDARAA